MQALDNSEGRGVFIVVAIVVFAPLWVTPIALGQGRVGIEYVPKVVVVQFEPGFSISHKSSVTGLEEYDQRASQYQVHLIERVYPFLDQVEPTPKTRRNLMALRRTYYVRYDSDAPPEQVAKDLNTAPGVVYAEPVTVHRVQALRQADPNDPGFSQQTELQQLRLPEAWDYVKGENGNPRVVIAIVDNGGEWYHEDLRANVWTNPSEIADNGIDDDDNGFIDDAHGVNFQNEDDANNDPTPLPTLESWEHGTLVAGAAGAVSDNGIGLAGVAWNADIMHINSGCRDSKQICHGYEGILYAAANGADIINASWGGAGRSTFSDQSLNVATDMGALIVAGAGNNRGTIDEHAPFYPALHPRVLSVGATGKASRRLAIFSNYGKQVSVFAPGEDILTTGPNDQYYLASGISLAAPLVAGVAALVKTRYPDFTPDRLREYIQVTSESIDAENPDYSRELGNGFVNALAAVRRSPASPGVQINRWELTDDDGNGDISPGDEVVLTVEFQNYFADAQQLRVELTGEESYPFLDWHTRGVDVGFLGTGESVAVEFTFGISDDASVNRQVKFFVRVRDGGFEDSAGVLSFTVNESLEVLHQTLSAFYYSTNGDGWVDNSGWDIGTTPPNIESLRQWKGLTVVGGALVGLSLPENNLNGKLPLEIEKLSQLTGLNLGGNSLTGEIPPELAHLSHLQTLNLRGNSLTGEIPPEFGHLPQLQTLSLEGNSLTGEIPPELGNLSQLKRLSLGSNSLTGEIPPELGHLSQLQTLNLGGNLLTGEIPPELGNLSQLARRLNLARNSLIGEIPSEFGNLTRLGSLSLSFNSLSGEIPPELGNLSQLYNLSLEGNSLTGEIPPELGNLSQLISLILERNSLTGNIPPELGNLSRLRILYLHNNSLTGEIPPEFGNLSRLRILYLEGGSLSGDIPVELGNLLQLIELNLARNSLTGEIPPELGRLVQLESLSLGGNSLSGEIPLELSDLPKLQTLSLEGNSLTGEIPPEFGNLSQLQRLYLRNNSLSGEIPPELGNLSQLQILFLEHNLLTGDLPPELGNLLKLTSLNLEGNLLSSKIPPEFGNISQLRRLFLGGNSLTGEIPPELGNLSQLAWLNLEGNSLTGEIPPELGNLSRLLRLSLGGNSLAGEIPPEFGNMSRLLSIDLKENKFSGTLPRSFVKLENLRRLFIANSGVCPPIEDEFQAWLSTISNVDALPAQRDVFRWDC